MSFAFSHLRWPVASFGTILNDGGTMDIVRCTFEENSAADVGGAVTQFRQQATTDAVLTVRDSNFTKCSCMRSDGGYGVMDDAQTYW